MKNLPYDGNRATFSDCDYIQNAVNRAHNKETVETANVVANYKGDLVTPITVRWYMGRSSSATVVYCSIWVHTADGRDYSGSGSAGGGGYHKTSAALDSAVSSAGIKMAKRFGGCGDGPSNLALQAIAKAAGYRKTTIVHG